MTSSIRLRPVSERELASVGEYLGLTGAAEMAAPLDLTRDVRVADVDGHVAGVGLLRIVSDFSVLAADGTQAAVRVQGLDERIKSEVGGALLAWTIERARLEPDVLILVSGLGSPEQAEIFEAFGFKKTRTLYIMENSQPSETRKPQAPRGYRVESSFRGDELVTVLTSTFSRAVQDTRHYRPPNPERISRFFAHPNSDPSLCFFALGAGEPVGFNFCWVQPTPQGPVGWVEDLGVDAGTRGIGLGSALLNAGVLAMASTGVEKVLLGVDSANPTPALQMYLNNGFSKVREIDRFELLL